MNSPRKISKINPIFGLFSILFILLLPACGEQVSPSSNNFFIPPTLSHKATSIPLETATPTPLPTPTQPCTDDLEFLEDISVPDDTPFLPGAEIEKTWLVKNTGNCNWDNEYSIQLIDGNAMGAETTQALFPARSGGEAEITIIFTAPEDNGANFSSWQAFNPQGEPFGDTFFIQIIVDPDLEPTEESNN